MRVTDELDLPGPFLTACMFFAVGAAVAATAIVLNLPEEQPTLVAQAELPRALPGTVDLPVEYLPGEGPDPGDSQSSVAVTP